MQTTTALRGLQALCEAALPPDMLVPALLEALHGVVPSSRNLFDWTDDDGRLLRYHFEGPIDPVIARLYFDEFHNRRETEAMLPFQALRDRAAGVYGPEQLDRPGFHESALFHEIWKPQGLHTRLEAVLRGRSGRLLGSLVLYRAPREPAFTTAERQRLARLLPLLAQALERGDTGAGPATADEPHVPAPGAAETLLLDASGSPCHASPGAWQLLLMAAGGASAAALDGMAQQTGGPLPQALLAQLRRTPDAPVQLQVDSQAGRIVATGQQLAALPGKSGAAAQAMVLVTLRRHEPRRVALERVLRSLPLTPGQAAVCRALDSGLPQAQIARTLGVAPSTVIDHLRKAYRVLDLHSAQELRALLDRRIAEAAA
jgi:DNA-binding CsgD family transcriptional regulator